MTQRLTREQAAIIGAYTGICCGPFSDVHAKIEQVLGRSVWTHEMADKELWETVRTKLTAEFMDVCAKEKE